MVSAGKCCLHDACIHTRRIASSVGFRRRSESVSINAAVCDDLTGACTDEVVIWRTDTPSTCCAPLSPLDLQYGVRWMQVPWHTTATGPEIGPAQPDVATVPPPRYYTSQESIQLAPLSHNHGTLSPGTLLSL